MSFAPRNTFGAAQGQPNAASGLLGEDQGSFASPHVDPPLGQTPAFDSQPNRTSGLSGPAEEPHSNQRQLQTPGRLTGGKVSPQPGSTSRNQKLTRSPNKQLLASGSKPKQPLAADNDDESR